MNLPNQNQIVAFGRHVVTFIAGAVTLMATFNLITPDQAMAMYVLDPAADGNVHRALKAPADPSAWAITVEPAEGSPTATGDIIFIADV